MRGRVFLLVRLDDLLGHVSWHFLVVVERRLELAAPAGKGAQLGRVGEQLGLRHVGPDDLHAVGESMPRTRPRRVLRSRLTSPMYSSGTRTSTSMIGSRRTGADSWMPLRVASWPARRNESSSESTVWNEPS